MAGSINKVVLVGNVGKDPEIRHTNTGKKIANFSLATSDSWKDASGQKQEKTEWHRIVVFNPNLSDFVEKYIHKGSKLYIEGSLQTRKWTDNSGSEKYVTEVVIGHYKGEIVLLDGRGDGNLAHDMPSSSENTAEASWDSSPTENKAPTADFEDEIPF